MKSRYIIMSIFILTLLFLPSCTRSASTSVPMTNKTDTEFLVATQASQEAVEKNITPSTAPTKPEPTKEATKPENTSTPVVMPTETPMVVISMPTTEVVYLTPSVPQATLATPFFQIFEGEGYGYPTFGIRGVVYNKSVTIQAYEFPAADTYTVTMSRANTNGVGAVEVASKETGEGGSFLETFDIPESLYDVGTIAVKIEFSDGQYAVNWFYNITTN